jgi:alpha-L-fucosidase 2
VLNEAPNQEWEEIQSILSNLIGVYDAPPANVVTNSYTAGQMMGNGDIGVTVGGDYRGVVFYVGKNDFWTDDAPLNVASSFKGVRPITVGGVSVSFGGEGTSPYRSVQDILHAQVRTILTVDNATVHIRSWTAAGENVLASELRLDGDKPLSAEVTTWVPTNDAFPTQPEDKLHKNNAFYPTKAGVLEGTLWATRETNTGDGVRWVSRAAIATCIMGAEVQKTSTDGSFESKSAFTLHPGQPVTVVSVINGGKDVTDLMTGALNRHKELTVTGIAQPYAAHLSWWKAFWLKSYIRVHDEALERYYYGALYNVACCSRAGKVAPGLMGNWITTDNPMCHSDYHLNYNFQAPYYGVYASNRIELAAPYYEPILDYIPEGKQRAREDISRATKLSFPKGARGVLYPVGIGPWGSTPDNNYHNQVSNATFAAIPFVWHYEYTQDLDFLEHKTYPLLRELADFWEDYLQKDEDGRYVVYAASYEGFEDLNPSQDLGFIRFLLTALLEASVKLGRDADRREKWREILDHLSKPPTFIYEGTAVFNRSESANTFMVGNTTDNLEFIHPGECLGLDSDPTDLQIAHDTITLIDAWTQGNNAPKLYPQAVRVGYPVDEFIGQFKSLLKTNMRNNLTLFESGGGIETSGSVETLNSMLLQSHEGVIKLFPVWFTDKPAHFKRLRAKGAFLVSSEYSNGEVTFIEVISEVGKTCTLKNPWHPQKVRLVERGGGGQSPATYRQGGELIIFHTRAAGHYHLTPSTLQRHVR